MAKLDKYRKRYEAEKMAKQVMDAPAFKEALKEQAIAMLMLDLKRAEERADAEGWIDADDLEQELGVID
jgi:hypothetical protein